MGPPDTWDKLRDFLLGLTADLDTLPKAFLIISAHWESAVPAITAAAQPPLIYDYYGFPAHTYELTWPAPGAPKLATEVVDLLSGAGIACDPDSERGFDHGVFVPMKLIRPEADIPTLALSLRSDLDSAFHLELGAALAPLRERGVLIIASGFSYHNFEGYDSAWGLEDSRAFHAWLDEALDLPGGERRAALAGWQSAPRAHACHPREEHLLPLMVAAGAALEAPCTKTFSGKVMGVNTAAYRFG